MLADEAGSPRAPRRRAAGCGAARPRARRAGGARSPRRGARCGPRGIRRFRSGSWRGSSPPALRRARACPAWVIAGPPFGDSAILRSYVDINIMAACQSRLRSCTTRRRCEMRDHCLCLHAQRAARALARRFDAAFRPLGLTSGQFSLLNVAEPAGAGGDGGGGGGAGDGPHDPDRGAEAARAARPGRDRRGRARPARPAAGADRRTGGRCSRGRCRSGGGSMPRSTRRSAAGDRDALRRDCARCPARLRGPAGSRRARSRGSSRSPDRARSSGAGGRCGSRGCGW